MESKEFSNNNDNKRKAHVLARPRSGPNTLTVTGAGLDCVNGEYSWSGQSNNVKKFTKVGLYEGKEQPIVVYRNVSKLDDFDGTWKRETW